MLLLTFDEDDNLAGNQIPTVFAGANIVPGSYGEHTDPYGVLRTLEDVYGLAPIGASATAGSGPSATLSNVSSNDSDLRLSVASDKLATGSGLYVSPIGRRVTGAGDYRAKVRLTSSGAVFAGIERVTPTGAETLLTPDTSVAGLTYAPGGALRIRLQVTGIAPTTLRVKVWRASGVEPSAWLATASDMTASHQKPQSLE